MSGENGTKLCRHCQTEIPKGAKICPNCRKKQGGKWKWLILVVVVVGVIGAVGGSGGDEDDSGVQKVANLSDSKGNQDVQAGNDAAGADKDQTEKDNAGENNTEKGNSEKEGTSDDQKGDRTADKNKEKGHKGDDEKDVADTGETDNLFKVGDVIKTSNFQITYLSAEKYVSDNEFIQPKKGNMYYEMAFEFENISDSDQTVSSFEFDCYADGYDMEQQYFADEQLDATLSPGKKTKGSLIFEVPSDSKEIILEYEQGFWSDDRIMFKGK